MKSKENLSRRDVTKQIGIVTGLGLVGPGLAMATLVTPQQTEGPFHPIDKQADTDLDLTLIEGHSKVATGEMILVRGRVLDIEGRPLNDALVDVWQANHFGRYSHPKDKNTAPLDPDFQGWGMITTDTDGRYEFKTIKPGPYPLSILGGEGWRCRHIHFKVSRSGSKELITQMYFYGDPLIEQDRQIAKVPEEHRHLLISNAVSDEVSGLPMFQFDIVLAPVNT